MDKNKCTSVYFDRKNLCFCGLEDACMEQLIETYRGVDVGAELKKMSLWLMSPKGARRKGNIGFILNWLNNAAPRHKLNENTEHTSLRPYIKEYLQELWKGREHILRFNKIKKKS